MRTTWTCVNDFIDHLKSRGLRLHVIQRSDGRHVAVGGDADLTEAEGRYMEGHESEIIDVIKYWAEAQGRRTFLRDEVMDFVRHHPDLRHVHSMLLAPDEHPDETVSWIAELVLLIEEVIANWQEHTGEDRIYCTLTALEIVKARANIEFETRQQKFGGAIKEVLQDPDLAKRIREGERALIMAEIPLAIPEPEPERGN